MVAASLSIDQSVEVREEGGCVIIEPLRTPGYDLGRLLAQMKPGTFPDEVDFGQPIGGEAW